ncbi:hypothetical protein SLEP1_g26914 [Rubroshorea leprosula]|uniref:Uncharacterized protein n=1 Tax=Rubroshorea leprosula TaxID=152421 RepID=A0AAV5JZY6_9ROSI|nr:hypothetical protein SLEP1_g26914 [Rubroshorea leprosula]
MRSLIMNFPNPDSFLCCQADAFCWRPETLPHNINLSFPSLQCRKEKFDAYIQFIDHQS